MQNLIKETVEKIKKQHVVPEPRWKYSAKKYGSWTIFGMIIFFGAVSFAIAFDMLWQLDWDLYRFVHQSAILYSLSLLPYFWIIFIGIFFGLAFVDLRKTETGYRYDWLKMSLASVGGIILLGAFFSLVGLGEKAQSLLAKDVPYYGQHLMMTKEKQWMQPEKGFLAGKLIAISVNRWEIRDLNEQVWQVDLDEKTTLKPAVVIAKGETVKIIGTKKDSNNFQAIEIRPWAGQGMKNGLGGGMRRGN